MKKYKITVNGKSYDVTVEEMNGVKSAPTPTVTNAPAAVPVAPIQPEPAQTAASVSGEASVTVKSPMPGTVMSFKVNVGQQVKRGDVLLLLEAMKMENEIVAPQDGTVIALRVSASAAVNTGDPLVDLA